MEQYTLNYRIFWMWLHVTYNMYYYHCIRVYNICIPIVYRLV